MLRKCAFISIPHPSSTRLLNYLPRCLFIRAGKERERLQYSHVFEGKTPAMSLFVISFVICETSGKDQPEEEKLGEDCKNNEVDRRVSV